MYSNSACALFTRDLTKRYHHGMLGNHTVYAVRDVNLTLKRGETVALLGTNGAGKTTLLKLILGLVRPSSGRVHISPPVHSAGQTHDVIGYAPEEFQLQSTESVSTILNAIASLKGLGGAERRRQVLEKASQVGLQSVFNRPVGRLSKGLRRKLAIAQSLIAAPSLLLLDEPMDGLDPEGRAFLRDVLDQSKGEGSSIVLCTHMLSEVERIADQIAILNEGKLVVVGYVRELLARHNSFLVYTSEPPTATTWKFFRSGDGWACRVINKNSLDNLVREAKAEGRAIRSITKVPATIESLFREFVPGENVNVEE